MKTAVLRKIGNSQGVILDKTVLELIEADEKTVFQIRIEDGGLSLRPLSRKEQKELIKAASKKVAKDHSRVLEKLSK